MFITRVYKRILLASLSKKQAYENSLNSSCPEKCHTASILLVIITWNVSTQQVHTFQMKNKICNSVNKTLLISAFFIDSKFFHFLCISSKKELSIMSPLPTQEMTSSSAREVRPQWPSQPATNLFPSFIFHCLRARFQSEVCWRRPSIMSCDLLILSRSGLGLLTYHSYIMVTQSLQGKPVRIF